MPAQVGISRARRAGFTLTETMVVLGITGILASVAIPTMSDYVQRARTSEAVQFLGVIKLRQEAFRSEFGGYARCGTAAQVDEIVFFPGNASVMRRAASVTWPTTPVACFDAIGARPDGAVRFGYGWATGTPGSLNGADTTYGLEAADADHWFVAQAVTDLDGDGIVLTMEVTSFSRAVWNSSPKSGWE